MLKLLNFHILRAESRVSSILFSNRRDPNSRIRILILSILVGGFFVSLIMAWWRVGFQIWRWTLVDLRIFDDFYGVRDENPSDYYLQDPYYGANPPGTMILGRLYALVPARASIVIFASFYLLTSSLIVMFVTNRKSSLLFMMFSYPFWFGVFRGNDDMYLFPLTLLLLWTFARGKLLVFGVIVGLMATIEPYFILFAFPLILKRPIAWKMIVPPVLVLTIGWASMALIGSRDLSLYWSLARSSPETYLENMAFGDGGMLFGNSLFGLLKFLASRWFDFESDPAARLFAMQLHVPYVLFAGFTGVVVLTRLFYRRNSLSSVFSILAILLILLPHVAATYKLVLLSAILIYQLFDEDSKLSYVKWRVICLAAILIPKPFPSFRMVSNEETFLDSIANPILMIGFLFFVLAGNDDYLDDQAGLKPVFGNQKPSSVEIAE